jgi:hypothetical protein
MSRTQQQSANQRPLPICAGLLEKLLELRPNSIEANPKFLRRLIQTAILQKQHSEPRLRPAQRKQLCEHVDGGVKSSLRVDDENDGCGRC